MIKNLVKHINETLGSERVIYYDYIEQDSDVRKLYAHAKAFVYISSNEAFGLPLVEAAGYGVPIIAQRTEINEELFGDSAFYVQDPQNISDVSHVFRDALQNSEKRKQMLKDYKKRIPQLSWHHFASEFFDNIQ